MITIKLDKDKIKVQGHSGYSKHGSDIVCASVSSITITSLNAILKYDENALKYKQSEGLIEVEILNHDKFIDLLLENMIEHLKDLEKQYKNYIKII